MFWIIYEAAFDRRGGGGVIDLLEGPAAIAVAVAVAASAAARRKRHRRRRTSMRKQRTKRTQNSRQQT